MSRVYWGVPGSGDVQEKVAMPKIVDWGVAVTGERFGV